MCSKCMSDDFHTEYNATAVLLASPRRSDLSLEGDFVTRAPKNGHSRGLVKSPIPSMSN